MWDINKDSLIRLFDLVDGVTTVAISPDGQLVAAGSMDNGIYVWDVEGYLLGRLEFPNGHSNDVYSVVFSPSGKKIISGSFDRTVKMWELHPFEYGQTGRPGYCSITLEGHTVSNHSFAV